MYLETPKGTSDGREWDAINLATLRELAERVQRTGQARPLRAAHPRTTG